jgi:TPR repeat protein
MYESNNSDYIVPDEGYSKQLFTQAAELGYKFSQFRMGSAYEYGLMDCPVDPRQSIIWYTRAAAQGEHQSELALSGWYLTGADGILQQSDTEAYLWARKAASAGLAKAEYALGYFTEVGIGVPSNLEDAKRWYLRAACKSFFAPECLACLMILYSSKLRQSTRAPRRTQERQWPNAKDARFPIGRHQTERG